MNDDLIFFDEEDLQDLRNIVNDFDLTEWEWE